MAAWSKYQNDFDAMTDLQIDAETSDMADQLEQAEEWLEAVAAWESAGRPRSTPDALKGDA